MPPEQQTTEDIVESIKKSIREAAEPYLGQSNTAEQQAYIKKTVEQTLHNHLTHAVHNGAINGWQFDYNEETGIIEAQIQPVYELKYISFTANIDSIDSIEKEPEPVYDIWDDLIL